MLEELIFLLPAKLVEEASSRRPVGQGYGCMLQLGGGGGSGVRQHRAAARVLASDVREIEGD